MEEALVSIAIAIASSAGFWALIAGKFEKKTAVNQALGALLRHEMFDIYEAYKNADCVPADVLSEMDSLHEAYHALGYNHLGDKIHAEIMAKKAES